MSILARDVMEKHVLTVAPETTLAELADLLAGKRIGGVPVVESGAVVGVVSRSDYARIVSLDRSLAEMAAEAEEPEEFAPGEVPPPVGRPAHLEKHLVRDVMVTPPVSVSPETPIREVAELLVTRHLHRLLVLEGKALRGVISALDVARLVASGKLCEPRASADR